MSNKQIFSGFSAQEEQQYAAEVEKMYDPETVRASNQKWQDYSAEQKQSILDEGRQVYVDMVAAMPAGADSAEAQRLVERWRAHMDNFWTPNLEQLLGLANLYNQDLRFKSNLDQLHPQLAAFMLTAVQAYVTGDRNK